MGTTGRPCKIGQCFGPYTLEANIGAGAFKNVYKAMCDGESFTVAIGFPQQQGAKIEQSIKDAMFTVVEADQGLRTWGVVAAAGSTHPLSKSQARKLTWLTGWASQNTKMAS